jgi:NAD(P)H-flavin reductase/quinol-cytochrome oxidoreductase complex cytochrome b subunit/ferredoxin
MITLLQRVLRAGFMRAEALFNRAFGDHLNPLYHLGAISFFLFFVIGGTGLVLYAFFDTSVAGAYRSVETFTHGGFGLGSVLRTVHRHASDAMLLSMLVHLLRYFAFDRLRGFRWFSWVTGVALLWLVYIAGANGYMLPWDRLAQFVTQASFEWLDWLPGFGGTLSRNFIQPDHVNDRLFSLLVFIHIGVPLVTLLLMWVHVQRVPKATTQPPRPIAIALVAMLLLLALLAPVASQGPADLRSAPALLSPDWFLLTIFPLLYAWPLGGVWGLVLGAPALLLLLPWLPPRRGGSAPIRLTLHPGPVQVNARAGETLLEAGLRAGVALPYDCRAGGCGVCACTVHHGRFDHGPYQPAALTEAMRARGQALMCCAVALEDIELEVEGVDTLILGAAAAAATSRRWQARVQTMERLSPDLMRLHLALPPGQRLDYVAGQYINILLDDGARRAFSFASAPPDRAAPQFGSTADLIELHVRLIPGGRFTTHVFEGMQVGDTVDFEGPLGRFTLQDSARPILFIAGATGFAPIKAILEDAFRRGVRRPMQLYWGVRTAADLYLLDTIRQWQEQHPNFGFVPVLSQAGDDRAWTGRRGLVHEALLADHPDLAGHEVYACGSVRMVEAAVPDFLAHGLDEQFCFSDAFTPTPSAPTTRPAG